MASILLTLTLLSCSKSNEEPVNGGDNPAKADYSVLLQGSSTLSESFINYSSEGLEINQVESNFPSFSLPEVSYRSNSKLSLYHKKGDCLGEILLYDFDNKSKIQFEAFSDLNSCNLTITAIAHTDSKLFLSFMIESAGKDKKYFVRTIQLESDNMDFVDLEFVKKPIQLVPTNDRLFILTFDEDITDENGINVMELTSGTIIHEMNLGADVGKIFENPGGDLIISYPELHTTLNTSNLEVIYTQYGLGTEPNFIDSKSVSFDFAGKMYYQMKIEDGATQTIPAVYDFDLNNAVLYYFENFLTDAQLNVEFNVEAATTLQYDDKNDVILIGYKKSGTPDKGGIMRITPSPDLTFVDNIDLEGIPYAIFIK